MWCFYVFTLLLWPCVLGKCIGIACNGIHEILLQSSRSTLSRIKDEPKSRAVVRPRSQEKVQGIQSLSGSIWLSIPGMERDKRYLIYWKRLKKLFHSKGWCKKNVTTIMKMSIVLFSGYICTLYWLVRFIIEFLTFQEAIQTIFIGFAICTLHFDEFFR